MKFDNNSSPFPATVNEDVVHSTLVASANCPNTTPKRVTFQPTTTIIRFHTIDNGEDRWVSTAERAQFVLDARQETKAWIAQGCTHLLKGIFHDTSDAAEEKIMACTQLPGRGYCRGLERYVCKEHGLTRDSFQRGALRTIVAESKKRKLSGVAASSDDAINESWQQLGDLSRRLTSFATLFAQRIGAADEAVVRYGEDPSKARKILQAKFEAAQEVQEQTTCPGSPASASTTTIDTEKVSSSNVATVSADATTRTPSKTRLVSRYNLMQQCIANANSPHDHIPRADYSACE